MTQLGRLHDWWTRPCGGREVLQVSLPLVVSTISTTVMIFIDRMFLLWYAPKAMAATTLAFTVNNVAWIPMWGLGTAVTAIVGQQLGRNRAELAARATWTALAIALAYMGTMALCYVTMPDWFLKGHAAGTSSEVFGPLRATTVVLLRFVAAYCLLDAMIVVFVSALRGAGGMRFILLTTLATSPPPLVAAWWGTARQGWGLLWCWTVITVWICSLGLIYLTRFLQGRWQQMRVIEPEAAA